MCMLHALSYMNYNAGMANTLDSREFPMAGRADAAFAGEVGRMVRLGRAKRGMSRRQLAQESGMSDAISRRSRAALVIRPCW